MTRSRNSKVQQPPPAIFPRRHALPPFSWPPQRHDMLALILTICACTLAWPFHKVILLLLGAAYLLRGWLWLCRKHPLLAWFCWGFVRGWMR
jgi:hypothetical protein